MLCYLYRLWAESNDIVGWMGATPSTSPQKMNGQSGFIGDSWRLLQKWPYPVFWQKVIAHRACVLMKHIKTIQSNVCGLLKRDAFAAGFGDLKSERYPLYGYMKCRYIFFVAHLSSFIMSSWIPEFNPGGETDWSTHFVGFIQAPPAFSCTWTGFYGLGHSESEGFRDVFSWKCHISIQLDILYHFVITGIIPSPLSVLKNCQVQALKMLKPLAHPRFAFVSLCLCVRWLRCLHHQHHRHHRHHGRHQLPMVAQCFARCRWMIL